MTQPVQPPAQKRPHAGGVGLFSGLNPRIMPNTSLREVERVLAVNRLSLISLHSNEEGYSVRIRRDPHLYFGCGRTLHEALASALDEIQVMSQASTKKPKKLSKSSKKARSA